MRPARTWAGWTPANSSSTRRSPPRWERKSAAFAKPAGVTFSANTGTAYAGLSCSRSEFDQVATMRVEGISISGIARITGRTRSTITGRTRSTITRWLALSLFNQTIWRGKFNNTVLLTSDGFEFCEKVARRVFGVTAVYAQVIRTRCNNRVIAVDRRLRIGTNEQLAEALTAAEDSSTVNTSFVEPLSLTLRQSLAYLQRKSSAYARSQARLDDDLGLVQCHYNFIRPHRGLKFGRYCKTPAMQA